MSIEQQKNFLIRFAFATAVLLLAIIALKFLLGLFLPFLMAFLIAALLNRPIRYLSKKSSLRRPLVAIPVTALFFCTAGLLTTLLGMRLLKLVTGLFAGLPAFYASTVEPVILRVVEDIEMQLARMDPAALSGLHEVAASLLSTVSGLVSSASLAVIGMLSNAATLVPGLFLGLLITIIVTFFVTTDYPRIVGFLGRQLPERARDMTHEVKDYVGGTLLKCLLSYGLIMAITFGELTLGLTLLGIPNAALIALAIATFDILPVLGTGGIMIPWAIFTTVAGDYGLALGLIAVYLVITVVRNIIEPKIVGHQVGLHPVVTLASMLAGLQLFGVLGLFGFPITLSLIKNLNDRGVVRVFR